MTMGTFKPYTADDLVRARIETPEYKFRNERTDTGITLLSGSDEMLRCSKEGFWVRGVKVEQDEQEAQKVYEGFKAWMMWAQLNRDYK